MCWFFFAFPGPPFSPGAVPRQRDPVGGREGAGVSKVGKTFNNPALI